MQSILYNSAVVFLLVFHFNTIFSLSFFDSFFRSGFFFKAEKNKCILQHMHLDISLCTFFALFFFSCWNIADRSNTHKSIRTHWICVQSLTNDAEGSYGQKNVRSKEKYEQNLQFTPTDIFFSLHLILNASNIFHYTNALHNIDTAIHRLVSAIQTRFLSVSFTLIKIRNVLWFEIRRNLPIDNVYFVPNLDKLPRTSGINQKHKYISILNLPYAKTFRSFLIKFLCKLPKNHTLVNIGN